MIAINFKSLYYTQSIIINFKDLFLLKIFTYIIKVFVKKVCILIDFIYNSFNYESILSEKS